MANQNFTDELWKGLGNAIADIRTKVVEEPLFGRAVTEQQPDISWPEAKEQTSPEPGSLTREVEKGQAPEMER